MRRFDLFGLLYLSRITGTNTVDGDTGEPNLSAFCLSIIFTYKNHVETFCLLKDTCVACISAIAPMEE